MRKTIMISVLLFSFFGCKKKYKDVNVNADLIRAFSFRPGTYWIYKNLTTGAIDSYYVVRNSNSSTVDGEGNKVYSNGVSVITTNLDLITLSMSINTLFLSFIKNKQLYALDYPFASRIGSQGDTMNLINAVDSMQLNSNVYKNVSTITIKNTNIKNDTLYISSESGVVKMNIHNEQDSMTLRQELLSSKIVK